MNYNRFLNLAALLIVPSIIVFAFAFIFFVKSILRTSNQQIYDFIKSSSSRDIAEGNYFRVGELLSSLGRTERLVCGQIASSGKILMSYPQNLDCRNIELARRQRILGNPIIMNSPNDPSFEIFVIPQIQSTTLESIVSLFYFSILSVFSILLIVISLIVILRRRQFSYLKEMLNELPEIEASAYLPEFLEQDFPKLAEDWKSISFRISKMREATIEKELIHKKAKLAAQVAHDIRSPLTALNLVIAKLENVPDETLGLARKAIARINDIANDLLKVQKQDSTPSFIILLEAIEEAVNEKKLVFGSRVQLKVFRPEGAEHWVIHFNRKELLRILSNILNNAFESMSLGEGLIAVRLARASGFTNIEIEDDGSGIDAEILPKLAQEGVTHGKENSKAGSGLGLYHARKALEKSGGKLDIKSHKGKGTLVSLKFPTLKNTNR